MNESQKRISAILHEIIHSEEEDIIEYYGIQLCFYSDEVVDKYLARLNDINDKIFLAQWCNNFKKVNELIEEINLSDYQRKKYEELKKNNVDLNETINFRILDEKYAFLDGILDMIVADKDTQDQIISLSRERLELFKLMCFRLNELTDYAIPYISIILQRIGYVSLNTHWKNKNHTYDDLLLDIDQHIRDGVSLTDNDVDTILYLCTSSVTRTVSSYEEIKRFGDVNTIDEQEFKEQFKEVKQTKNIDMIKFLLLAKIYGIHLNRARELCKRYNIQGIEVTSENKDLFEMYMAVSNIVYESNVDVLIALYEKFMTKMQPKPDFRRIVVFENEMRKAFAHDLSKQVFKTENQNYSEVDGVLVYDAGLDFKMIVTAIGAYQSDFANQENYSKYWNSPIIRSHGNCCSLIGNSNLSTAKVKNILLGFSSMSDNMLLLSGSSDLNSTPDSRNFDATKNGSQQFMSADNLLDETRGDYNELVYERRDLTSNPVFYKKNPDYLVFIEEYESFDAPLEAYKNSPKHLEYIMRQKDEQDKNWLETLKAAKDFGIPIVKINRERVARNEYQIIMRLVEEFKSTKDPLLLSKIITRFENNRVGNSGAHAPVRERFFSQKNMSMILDDLKACIYSEENEELKNELYLSLYKGILQEQQRVKACDIVRKNNQVSGINFEKELADLEQLFSKEYFEEVGGRK